jgi:hypothetical protein
MYKYKVKLSIFWKNLEVTYVTLDIESMNLVEGVEDSEEDYDFFMQSVITDYEATLPDELLENIGYIDADIIDVIFLGD